MLLFERLNSVTATRTHVSSALSSDATGTAAEGPTPGGSGSGTGDPPFPACTFSRLPPVRVRRPASVTRCVEAQEWSCCEACDDWVNALQVK